MNTVPTIATVALWLIAFVAAALVIAIARSRFREAARVVERARVFQARLLRPDQYQMRYTGGDAPCSVCGKPTAYSLRGKPMHPEHRKDVA